MVSFNANMEQCSQPRRQMLNPSYIQLSYQQLQDMQWPMPIDQVPDLLHDPSVSDQDSIRNSPMIRQVRQQHSTTTTPSNTPQLSEDIDFSGMISTSNFSQQQTLPLEQMFPSVDIYGNQQLNFPTQPPPIEITFTSPPPSDHDTHWLRKSKSSPNGEREISPYMHSVSYFLPLLPPLAPKSLSPKLTEAEQRRKAQNRASQRAFRERKEQHMKEVEKKCEELEKKCRELEGKYEEVCGKLRGCRCGGDEAAF